MIPQLTRDELEAAVGNPVAKPISTEWQRTSNARTEGGATEYEWICVLCGHNAWSTWGRKLKKHECPVLDEYFPTE